MLSIAVTNLDLFRVWREEEDLDLGWLLSRFRGEEQTDEMRAGKALHKALECILEGEQLSLLADGYRFEFVKDVQLEIPGCRELNVSKTYGDLRVNGRVDAVSGITITDYKTTGQFDPDRLMRSFQWRFYLDAIPECDVFRWLVFVIKELDAPKVYSIVDFHRLEQTRYPDLHSDCARLAEDYSQFAREHPEILESKPAQLSLEEQLKASVVAVKSKRLEPSECLR